MKTAKELFMEYACSHFFLAHDGMFDEYIKLGGNNPIEEKKWRDEYIQNWLKKINENELLVFRQLSYANAFEVLKELTDFNSFKDDYIKFWYAFELLNISKHAENKIEKRKAQEKAYGIFKMLSIQNIRIKPENRKLIDKTMLDAFNAKTKEEYIRNYSIRLLGKKA